MRAPTRNNHSALRHQAVWHGPKLGLIPHMAVNEAIGALRSQSMGLSQVEATERLEEFGPNCIPERLRAPIWLMFAQGFTHFFAIILWIGAGLAFMAEYFEPGQGMGTIGAAILAVILINGVFSFWQQYKAELALDTLQELLPQKSAVLRDETIQLLPIADLVPGDIIDVNEGDLVPADCRVLSTLGISVNNAVITGESVPQFRTADSCDETDILAATNVLLAGAAVTSGKARALVVSTGSHTEFGRMAELTQSTHTTLSPLQRELAALSRVIGVIALLMGASFFVVGHAIGLSLLQNFVFAIGIIVANVPEGLLPTVTLAMAMGAQRMAKKNALVRHLPSVETLGSTTVICTDKTGTITQNRMTVVKAYVDGEVRRAEDVDGVRSFAEKVLLDTAYTCHTLTLSTSSVTGAGPPIGDPLEVALFTFAQSTCSKPLRLEQTAVLPFDSARRRLTMAVVMDDGCRRIYSKGALDAVLPNCGFVMQNDAPVPLDSVGGDAVKVAERELAESGLRVLAFAFRPLRGEMGDLASEERDMVLLGLLALEDPPRPEVADAVCRCREAGIRIIMVTGDHPATALSIGSQVGLFDDGHTTVVTGEQLRVMSPVELQIALDTPNLVFARTTAEQKARIVLALQRKGETVAVTGDGVNDAPALQAADIGVSMGMGGADVARGASDLVLLDNNFATIVSAIEEGRTVYANIRKFIRYILTHEPAEILPYIAFVLFPVPLGITATQILVIDLGSDTIPALALGAEPASPDIMRQPPRDRHEHLINRRLITDAYLIFGLIEALGAAAACAAVLIAGGWHYGMRLAPSSHLYHQATTATLTAVIVIQLVNVFVCRGLTWRTPSKWRENPLLPTGLVIAGLLLLGLNLAPPLKTLFATSTVPLVGWCVIGASAALLLLAGTLRERVSTLLKGV